jgi:predicted DNA-binding transcriptional regulator YafY
VQQGPAKKPALLKAVYARVGEDAYGYSEGEALAKKFDRDKRRLRKHLGVNVRYDASAGGYVIAGHEAALLNLSDTHLETLAFLADTFEPDSPHGRQVQELVDTLTGWLPDDRRRAYRRMRGLLPDVELPLRDSEPITPEVWEKVLTAHNDRQQLKFDYLSSSHSDDVPRQHVVEPWHLYFSQRGHYRLDAYCLFNDGPHGPWEPHRFFNYRLSRIVPGSVEILPTRLPPSRTQRPYEVVYELSPQIARFGVSPRPELIAPPKIEEGEEGWVSVKGQTYDVFHLARNLLYYGAHCRVLGGPELRGEVEKLVQGLREMYE